MNNKIDAKQKIETLWNQIREIYGQNFDIKENRLHTILGKDYLPHLVFDYKHSRTRKSKLEVVCDGEIIPGDSANDVLLGVIQKVTVEVVESLNIITDGGNNMITDYQKGMEMSSYRKIGNKVVYIKTGIDEKYRQIRQIIDLLGLDYVVSMK